MSMSEDIREENKKIRRLRFMVDFTLEYIRTQRTHSMTRPSLSWKG